MTVSLLLTVALGLIWAIPCTADDRALPEKDETTADRLTRELKRQEERIVELERQLKSQSLLLQRLEERFGQISPAALALGTASGTPHKNESASVRPEASFAGQAAPSHAGEADKKIEGLLRDLGGFRFSGDFRYRFDLQARSRNSAAGPLQNIRNRYRLRLNIDKEIDPRFRFHLQLSTAPVNNGITNDQDFGATIAKHPFSIAAAYVDFHPSSKLAFRVGRMEEIFADNMRFLWDDDVRFNGFHQIVKLPMRANALGLKSFELRFAEYILSNPNVAILSAASPFVSAGFEPGKNVGAANLFHPGLLLQGSLGQNWSHNLIGDLQIYRNPNQIQLASTTAGFPVLINNTLGIALGGPMTGTGNATTTAGGAIYNAPHFQIARLAYRIEAKALRLGNRSVPAWVDLQASRNTGTSKLRDAVMASMNLGAVRERGNMRLLYQFAIKDANALISQFTDDDLGTGSGVNIAVHALRFDLGLTRFLQWQNLMFIQTERRASNPADQFFVPLPRGSNPTFRFLGQLAFTF